MLRFLRMSVFLVAVDEQAASVRVPAVHQNEKQQEMKKTLEWIATFACVAERQIGRLFKLEPHSIFEMVFERFKNKHSSSGSTASMAALVGLEEPESAHCLAQTLFH